MSPQDQKEYINGLKSWIEEDKKVVFLGIAFDLAVVALTVSEKAFGPEGSKSPLIAIGMLAFLLSAYSFFQYYHRLHMASRDVHEILRTLKIDDAKLILTQAWQEKSSFFNTGLWFLFIGITLFTLKYFKGVSWMG